MKTLRLALLVLACAVARADEPPPKPNYHVPRHGHGDFVATPDGRIYYEREGAGPALILVPGGPGGTHANFHPWFSRLAAKYTVIYFDNLGRGRSDRLKDPKRYTVERDAEDIEALRQALGFERITVLGHSYGSMPALAYAVKYANRLDRLILNGSVQSGPGWQHNIDSANQLVRTQFPEILDQLMALRVQGIESGDPRYRKLYGEAEGDMYWFNLDDRAKS